MSDKLNCQASCLAETFHLKDLHAELIKSNRVALYRDALLLEIEQGICAVFDFGVAVFWNCRRDVIERLTEQFAKFSPGQLQHKEHEHYSYTTSAEKNHFSHDQMNLMGIVKLDDIRHIMFNQEMYDSTRIRDLMISPQWTIESTDQMEEVARIFAESQRYNIPVLQKGKYLGFVSRARVFSSYREMLKHFSDD